MTTETGEPEEPSAGSVEPEGSEDLGGVRGADAAVHGAAGEAAGEVVPPGSSGVSEPSVPSVPLEPAFAVPPQAELSEPPAGADQAAFSASGADVAHLLAVVAELRAERDRDRLRFLTHGVVDQAAGILMARTGGSSAEAFHQLADLAKRTDRDVVAIAADLVGEAQEGWPAAATDEPRLRPAVLALDRAEDESDLARLLVGQGLGWSGAAAAAVAVLAEDGALVLAGAAGFPHRSVSQWSRIPPALDCMMTRAVRGGTPVWVDESARDVPPLLGESAPPTVPEYGTRLAAPLVTGRRLLGAVEIAWPTGTKFDPEQRREIAAVAQAVAPSLFRTELLDLGRGGGEPADLSWQVLADALSEAAVVLDPVATAGSPVTAFRIAAANRSARSMLGLGTDPVGRRLIDAAPWTAGFFDRFVAAYEGGGVPVRFSPGGVAGEGEAGKSGAGTGGAGTGGAGSAPDPAPAVPGRIRLTATRIDEHLLLTAVPVGGAVVDAERWARLERLGRIGSWEWDLGAGTAKWSREALMLLGSRSLAEVTPLDVPPYTVHPEDVREARRFAAVLVRDGRPAETSFRVLQEDGAAAHVRMAGVPLPGDQGQPGTVFGTVQDVSHLRRTETALEIARVQLAAQRTRVDVERQVATLLQHIVIPDAPVRPPAESGVDVAARYRPASATAGVGGDWYGVFPLPGSRVLLTIGDVAGHGLAAASAMAQLYHTAHGLALTGAGPAALLHWLNALTCERPEFTIASSCCALYDPAERTLTWANAGHPSPVLVAVRSGTAATLEAPIGTMLGAAAMSLYEEDVVAIEPGDHLLLYTDGLVERRRQSDEESTGHLLAMAEDPDGDLDSYADRLVSGAHSDTDDDVCLIAVRFR